MQIKPPDVTGAQLHRDQHNPQSPTMRRHHRNDSFDSSMADDQYHTLLPLQRTASSRFGSREELVSGGRSPGTNARPGAGYGGRGDGGGGAGGGTDGNATEMGGILGGARLIARMRACRAEACQFCMCVLCGGLQVLHVHKCGSQ